MAETPFGWLSLLPPGLAIGLAIATRRVVPSLLAGIWIGWVIHEGWDPLAGTAATLNTLVEVFQDAGQTRVIIFTMLMGSLLIVMQRSGGIDGFLAWVGRWRWSGSRRGAQLMASLIGLGLFIESTITVLVVGAVSRPLFDRLKISREKLAYIADSTSAPVCMLIPFNGWGATVLGLLGAQAALGNLGGAGPLAVLAAAVPLNFYALLAVVLVFIVSAAGWDVGPMRRAERRVRDEGKVLADGARPVVDEEVIAVGRKPSAPPRLVNLLAPLVAMVAMVCAGLAMTGMIGVGAARIADPGLMDYLNQASGSTAVFWAVSLALALALVLYRSQRIIGVQEFVDLSFKGAGGMLPLSVLLVLAFAIGMTANAVGTGPWVAASVQPYLTPALVAPLVFVISSAIAFATGTSWGTFAIMIPLAVPLVVRFNAEGAAVSLPLVVSAVLGGGVFGDHCSPISDTTVVSSMASACDHIDHVRTQMPYALLAAAGALVLYLAAGLWR